MRLHSMYLKVSVLVALLVFGQAAVLAHHLGHDLQATDVYCTDCLTQSVFSGAVAASSRTPATVRAASVPRSRACEHAPFYYFLTPTARAPPDSC